MQVLGIDNFAAEKRGAQQLGLDNLHLAWTLSMTGVHADDSTTEGFEQIWHE